MGMAEEEAKVARDITTRVFSANILCLADDVDQLAAAATLLRFVQLWPNRTKRVR